MKPLYLYIIAGAALFMAVKFYRENTKLKAAATTAKK